MRFAPLSSEQLEELREDFIAYLITNGIDAKLWLEIKEKDATKADLLIEQFSDLVWYKILSSKRFAHYMDNEDEYYFDFGPENLNVLRVQKETDETFTLGVNQIRYTEEREVTFFKYLQSGASLTDGSKYKELVLLWAERKSN